MTDDEPRPARRISLGDGGVPTPAFDSWPPSGWFIGPDETGDDGQPFDWSAPSAGFSVELAYRWVFRAAALYRHWESIGWTGPRNGPSSSALTNAYMLVDDLRRRGLVPPGDPKRFDVEMNDCPPGFEAKQLARVRDWLGRVVESSGRATSVEPRLAANYSDGTVTIDGVTHRVGDVAAAFIHALLASADWVSLRNLNRLVSELPNVANASHPERVMLRLPQAVRDAIEVDQQRGHPLRAGDDSTPAFDAWFVWFPVPVLARGSQNPDPRRSPRAGSDPASVLDIAPAYVRPSQ